MSFFFHLKGGFTYQPSCFKGAWMTQEVLIVLFQWTVIHPLDNTNPPFQPLGPRARFSKVPKFFEQITGDIIHFVSSKQRRLEVRNFVVILFFFFIPFATYEKTSFTE